MYRQDFTTLAQEAWQLLEPYHAEVYFAPEHREGCDESGLQGGWMAYVASRAAPLGAASAELVTALFYNFAPEMVHRAIPAAWDYAPPEEVLQVRYRTIRSRASPRLRSSTGQSCDRPGIPLRTAGGRVDRHR